MSKYVIVDLEMCNVPRTVNHEVFPWRNEIIQIGAVMIDEEGTEVDRFITYVSPQYGAVDSYIRKLTGITPEDTKAAPATDEALLMFAKWLPEDAVLVSWSENDEIQVRREIEAKQICIPELERLLDNWVDCQKTFAEKMNSQRNYRLSEALIIADINYEDGAHDALVDAYNTALLFVKMRKEPKLILSSYYVMSDDDTDGGTFSGLLSNCRYAV